MGLREPSVQKFNFFLSYGIGISLEYIMWKFQTPVVFESASNSVINTVIS